MANQQNTQNNSKQQTRTLPKNFRQIGEPGTKKIYMEDYVYTYLNKLAQPGNLYARGAVLFGNACQTPAGLCPVYQRGRQPVRTLNLIWRKVCSRKKTGKRYTGSAINSSRRWRSWDGFLSRMGFSVDLNDKIIRTHMDNFSGENKVLYMIDALENEDAFYQFENYSLKKTKGILHLL